MKKWLCYTSLLLTLVVLLNLGVPPFEQRLAHAADTGARYPATVATTAAPPYNGIDWDAGTAGYVGADNTTYCTITDKGFDSDVYSYRLDATNFGFTFPPGATIDGIVVEFERSYVAKSCRDDLVQLIKAGTPQGNNNSANATWDATDTIVTFGGNLTDLWGLQWTAADIIDSNFGVAVACMALAGNSDPQIDFLRITVYYTPPVTSISNAPDTYGFGPLEEGSITETPPAHFVVTNNGTTTVNISIQGTDLTGSLFPWELNDDAIVGEDIYGLMAGIGGTYNVTVMKTGPPFETLINSLAASANVSWGLQLLAPASYTGSDGPNSGNVTLSASEA